MEAVIKTSDKKTFQKIMDYLKSLGVSVYATDKSEQAKKEKIAQGKFKSKREFEALAGLWEGRNDRTLENLRKQAWPRRQW